VTILRPAATPGELDDIRRLFRAFIAWHRQRHHAESALLDTYYDADAFTAELDGLPGKYGPPRGRLLLALHDGHPAGCVGLQDLGDGACEMKRMFVDPAFHGRGIGRALGEAIIADARTLGYRVMRLDTGARQHEAQALYQRLGFRVTPPYYPVSDELRAWLVFMELRLA
jgi:GNAT superfamily N-acetyltransferase